MADKLSGGLSCARYMQIRAAYSATRSHDGKTMFFLSTMSAAPQVYRLCEAIPWPVQVTFFDDRVMGVYAHPTEPYLIVSSDVGGSERAQIYLVSHDGQTVENLTGDMAHVHQFGGFSSTGKQFVYASNARDDVHFDVYVYDLETRVSRCVFETDDTNYAAGFSADDRSVFALRMHTNVNADLFLVDIESGDALHLTHHQGDAHFSHPRAAADGRTAHLITDLDSEFARLATLDLETLALTYLTDDLWDVEQLEVAQGGKRLVYSVNEDGTSALFVRDLEQNEGARRVAGLPVGTVVDFDLSKDGAHVDVTVSSPLHAVEVWRVALDRGDVWRLTFASEGSVPHDSFVEPELIAYPSLDGLMIKAYYYKPKGDGPFPVIVDVHGGPEGQSTNLFPALRQYFVQCGYAVLAPNVRGSSGYGRTYLHLDDVRKRMDSVADLAHAVDWLCEHGNARRDAIAVMGGSYGGFMVLAAVTHYPDRFAAGVDLVGIANLRTFIENTSPYRRHLRECEYGTVEADGDFFDEISPIHHVDRITAPMIVIHGANDPRVPISEAEQIVEALQKREHPVEYLRFEDEGHGVVKLPNRIKTYTAIAAFLDRHLK